jgi:hypothetical protein
LHSLQIHQPSPSNIRPLTPKPSDEHLSAPARGSLKLKVEGMRVATSETSRGGMGMLERELVPGFVAIVRLPAPTAHLGPAYAHAALTTAKQAYHAP